MHPAGRLRISQAVRKRIGHRGVVERIVRVAARVEAIERAAVIRVERQTTLDPFQEIGVGDEVAAEGDQTGVAVGDTSLRCRRIEAACGDDRPRKILPSSCAATGGWVSAIVSAPFTRGSMIWR